LLSPPDWLTLQVMDKIHHNVGSTAFTSLLCSVLLFSAALCIPSCAQSPAVAQQSTTVEKKGDSILSASALGGVSLGERSYPVEAIDFQEVNLGGSVQFALIIVFDEEQGFVIVPAADDEPEGSIFLWRNEEVFEVNDIEWDEGNEEDSLFAVGQVTLDNAEPQAFAMEVHIGAGSSTFKLEGETAILNGDLGSSTYGQVQYLIAEHPEVTTILFQDVPGSINDEINVETGRLIRQAGFTTMVPSDGIIASGGVDLFCAGVQRVIEPGAQIGVHSWAGMGDEIVPADLPRDHPAHDFQIAYFQQMLPDGVEFYFYTLNAAPAEDIHFMSADEIKRWKLATE